MVNLSDAKMVNDKRKMAGLITCSTFTSVTGWLETRGRTVRRLCGVLCFLCATLLAPFLSWEASTQIHSLSQEFKDAPWTYPSSTIDDFSMVPPQSLLVPQYGSLTTMGHCAGVVPSRGIRANERSDTLVSQIHRCRWRVCGMGRRPRLGILRLTLTFVAKFFWLLVRKRVSPTKADNQVTWDSSHGSGIDSSADRHQLVHPTVSIDIDLIRDEANVSKDSQSLVLRYLLGYPPCAQGCMAMTSPHTPTSPRLLFSCSLVWALALPDPHRSQGLLFPWPSSEVRGLDDHTTTPHPALDAKVDPANYRLDAFDRESLSLPARHRPISAGVDIASLRPTLRPFLPHLRQPRVAPIASGR
ncbi:hypothetical protein H5410_005358 [Solanum commersonii]|uniref:Transmembrane protein n=1 Tax=Solanum commersonii TaxID=4109 RepID=A0A9J6A7D0_SOLCO|nr:hypothetical protein H5410_005358 [Solanum commersonii]